MEIKGSLIREVMGMNGALPYFHAGRRYRLSRFNLVRAGYPAEIQNDQRLQKYNQSLGVPIVVEKNRSKYGNVPALNYFVPAIVIAGAARRARLLAEGNTRAWGWVEKGALPIQGEDFISTQELLEKLQAQLSTMMTKPSAMSGSTGFPWIIAFYPFENYLIYQIDGSKYRLGFNLFANSREAVLAGAPSEVSENYLSSTAQRDLLRRTCSYWSKPREAVAMFLNDTKTGLFKPLKCSAYLPETEDPIFQLLDEKLIGYMDFVRWSLQEQADNTYKSINGKKYAPEQFTVINKHDKSTWIRKK